MQSLPSIWSGKNFNSQNFKSCNKNFEEKERNQKFIPFFFSPFLQLRACASFKVEFQYSVSASLFSFLSYPGTLVFLTIFSSHIA